MKADTQHLDFLISQYVDGSLEGAGKKSVEQKMLADPQARQLYAEHRDVQDLLDDYGNRIPLINWDEFDQQLDARLEAEARDKERASLFRRRLKPVAAAACLLLAAALGYAWHALSHEPAVPVAATTPAVERVIASHKVAYEGAPATHADSARLSVVEPAAAPLASAGTVDGLAFSAPADQVALRALESNISYGLGYLPDSMIPRSTPRTVVGTVDLPATQKDDGDPLR